MKKNLVKSFIESKNLSFLLLLLWLCSLGVKVFQYVPGMDSVSWMRWIFASKVLEGITDFLFGTLPILIPLCFKQSQFCLCVQKWLADKTEEEELAAIIGRMVLTVRRYRKSNRFAARLKDGLARYVVKLSPAVTDYRFNYILEGFVEEYMPDDRSDEDYKKLREACHGILSSYIDSTPEASMDASVRKIAFCAYYLLSLICKKQCQWKSMDSDEVKEAMEVLEELCHNKKYLVFNCYPLYHEVCARWLKRAGRVFEALEQDAKAIGLCSKVNVKNHAVYASYISSACSCLDLGIRIGKEIPRSQEKNNAYLYSEECIKAHPGYAKYYYLKARLVYLDIVLRYVLGTVDKSDYFLGLSDAAKLCEKALRINDVKKVDENAIGHRSALSNEREFGELSKDIRRRLQNVGGDIDITIASTSCCVRNERSDIQKPNEDFRIEDPDHKIYIVMDGITRPHEEYGNKAEESVATKIASEIAVEIHKYMVGNVSSIRGIELLRMAVLEANNVIRKKFWGMFGVMPGAVGIITYVHDGVLYYLSMGDCGGMKIRVDGENYCRQYFGRQNSIEATAIEKIDRQERSKVVCNNLKHRLRYAVCDGRDEAVRLAEVGEVVLNRGDRVFIYSDGMERFFRYANPIDVLKSKNLDEIIRMSKRYDEEPYCRYADDKTVIMVECR